MACQQMYYCLTLFIVQLEEGPVDHVSATGITKVHSPKLCFLNFSQQKFFLLPQKAQKETMHAQPAKMF